MCAECEGLGRVSTVDIDALVDRDKSLNEGAITFPGFQPGTWYHRIYTDSGFFDPDKPLRDFTDAEWERLLYGQEAKVKTENFNLTYVGLVDKIRSRTSSRTPTRSSRACARPSSGSRRRAPARRAAARG